MFYAICKRKRWTVMPSRLIPKASLRYSTITMSYRGVSLCFSGYIVIYSWHCFCGKLFFEILVKSPYIRAVREIYIAKWLFGIILSKHAEKMDCQLSWNSWVSSSVVSFRSTLVLSCPIHGVAVNPSEFYPVVYSCCRRRTSLYCCVYLGCTIFQGISGRWAACHSGYHHRL